ncbi:MAG: hypothetical protein JNL01_07565 [Bdellovibrionales bacterium]|nr:hypothetical protein [Bdellovibrionales bacterium]
MGYFRGRGIRGFWVLSTSAILTGGLSACFKPDFKIARSEREPAASASASPSASPSPSVTPSASPSASATPSASPSASATPSASPSASATPSASPSTSPSPSPTSSTLACTVAPGTGCDVILSPNSSGAFNLDGRSIGATFYAGKKLCIPSRAQPYLYFWMYQTGGEENRPVTVTNCGGKVEFKKNTNGPVISFEQSSYVHLTGTGSSAHEYGIFVQQTIVAPALQASGHGVVVQPGSSDAEIDHVEVAGVPLTWDAQGKPLMSGGLGIAAETYPRCSDGKWAYNTWEMKNIKIHHNYIHEVRLEGLYLGPSHWGFVPATGFSIGFPNCPQYYEASGRNVVVENNIIENTGNDAFQAGGVVDGLVVKNNIIRNFGLNGDESHSTGIQVGGGSKGWVERNWVSADVAYRTQGIKHGGLDGTTYLNNVIAGVRVGVALLSQSDIVAGLPQGHAYFYHNTFANIEAEAISVYCTRLGQVHFTNNIFAGYGTQYYTGTGPNISCIGNYTQTNYLNASQAAAKFVDPANLDFHLLPNSPAANTGQSLLGTVDKDYDGNNRTGQYDHGAFVH